MTFSFPVWFIRNGRKTSSRQQKQIYTQQQQQTTTITMFKVPTEWFPSTFFQPFFFRCFLLRRNSLTCQRKIFCCWKQSYGFESEPDFLTVRRPLSSWKCFPEHLFWLFWNISIVCRSIHTWLQMLNGIDWFGCGYFIYKEFQPWNKSHSVDNGGLWRPKEPILTNVSSNIWIHCLTTLKCL